MKLFITSIGFDDKVSKKLDSLLSQDRASISIGVVINAKRHKPETDFNKAISRQEKTLMGLGYKNFQLIDLDTYREQFDFDVIYIIGGNTFYLLDSIKRNAFKEKMQEFLDKGGIIVGQSAGSYVLCPTIEMANWKHQDKNIVGLKSLKALNLIPFLVSVHYNNSFDNAIKKGVKNSGLITYALKDGQAIYYDDKKIEFLNGKPKLFS